MGLDIALDPSGDGGGGRGGGGEGGNLYVASSISCSICLDAVSDDGERSWAKLQCGHQFHLDCIGSAFNAKGTMQCPNCRKVEKGHWLYASNSRSIPDFSMDDWAHEEDLYDLGYSELQSFGIHWCPFSGITRLPPYDESDFPPAFNDVLRHNTAMMSDHGGGTVSHPCPYVEYFGPIHPSSSSNTGVSDVPNYWAGPDLPQGPYSLVDLHYNYSDNTHRPPRGSSRSTPYVHNFIPSHSHSSTRGGGSVPYQGSNARSRDRVQALQLYYQQPGGSGGRRSGGGGGGGSRPETTTRNFFPMPNTRPDTPPPAHIWERENFSGSLQSGGGSGSGDSVWSLSPYPHSSGSGAESPAVWWR